MSAPESVGRILVLAWAATTLSLAAPNAGAQSVVINEIFYHAPDELNLEYVELFNAGDADVDLSGWKLTDGIKYECPFDTTLKAGDYLVVAKDSALMKEFYGLNGVGEYKKSLSNSGDTIKLLNREGELVDEVTYTDRDPWPVTPDGYSSSLERVYAKGDAGNVANWEASEPSSDYSRIPAGTPGRANSVSADTKPPVIATVSWHPKQPGRNSELRLKAVVEDPDSLESVVLGYRLAAPGRAGKVQSVPMVAGENGEFTAKIGTGKENNRILGFWVAATSKDGVVASKPRAYDLRPSYSVYVNDAVEADKLPVLQFFHLGKQAFEAGESYRSAQTGRGYGGYRGGGYRHGGLPRAKLSPQGASAVVFTDPDTGVTELFDFVNITRRKSGWKVRFHKDRPLHGITTMNVLYEPNEATIQNESLAYQLYELAGNAAHISGYCRLMINGQHAGYHLYFEQPNGNFLRRNEIDNDGDLYKVIWMGNAQMSERVPRSEISNRYDIIGRHEKIANRHTSHKELVMLVERLEQTTDDREMWRLIEANFDVDNVINYFAVNSLLSHWDGFFNNYFLYYDRKGTKKWSLYPWDQDSTWSLRGGSPDDLYRLPLYFGAEGATPNGIVARDDRNRFGGRHRGFGRGRYGWWRDGGEISRPLLANPEFNRRFRKRLDELTKTVFIESVFGPKIDKLRDDLEPEVRLRARMRRDSERSAVDRLGWNMRGLHEHLKERRHFVVRQLQRQ